MSSAKFPDFLSGTPQWLADTPASLVAGHASPANAWPDSLRKGLAAAEQVAKHAAGAFAVGLFDAETQRNFGAVDRFAMQTLCWRVDGDLLRFATSAAALAGPNAAIDPQAIFDYLFFHCIPSPRTIFKDVFRVPPAHCVTLDQGRVTVAPYWTPAFSAQAPARSFEDLRDEFRGRLLSAVKSQLGDGPPACFLSGGTDSSTVAGMIREATGRGAWSYSIGFAAEGYDEMAYARLAAKRFGCEHHEYYVTPEDLVRSIADVAASFDQPFGNSSVLPSYYCALQARKDGVNKLLAGDGGDELFGGNARYAKQRVFSVYDKLPGALRSTLIEPFFGSAVVSRTPLLKKGSSYVEQARVPMPDRLQMYNLLLRLGVDQVLTPDFLAQVNVNGPAQHQRGVWAWAAPATTELNRTLSYDWRYTLGESDLPKVRGAAQLAGVAVGYPLLDAALLEFSLHLPDAYKLKGLKLRWFFKEALRGFLPDEILTKSKHGFGLPFGTWANQHAGLRSLAADSLRSLGTRGVVRPEFIRQLLDERMAEHPGYYGEMVWVLMMLEQWLRRHRPNTNFAA